MQMLLVVSFIMRSNGIIRVDVMHQGRKASADCTERPIEDEEYPWGEWFLEVGGFKNATQVDINGWNPPHHACDFSTCSIRGSLSAIDLLKTYKVNVNAATTGPRPPPGLRPQL